MTLDEQEGGLSNEGLGCGCLSGMCSGLLRLGDICASVLAIIDVLTGSASTTFISRDVSTVRIQGSEHQENRALLFVLYVLDQQEST